MSVAQRQEFIIYGLGGMSNLSYKFDAGKVGGGIGGGIGIGYICNITDAFGLTTGLGFMSYGGNLTSDELSEEYTTPDNDGDDFLFSYSIAGYKEKQRAALLTVPLMAQYSIPIGAGNSKVLIALGAKFGIPMSGTSTITPGSITTSGYYAYENRTYTDYPQHGFVTGQSASETESDIEFGFTVMASVEAGIHFSLSEKTGLYTGLFLDYGLTDCRKTKSAHIVEYQPSDQSRFKYSSILNTGIIDKVNLFSAGVKIGVRIKN